MLLAVPLLSLKKIREMFDYELNGNRDHASYCAYYDIWHSMNPCLLTWILVALQIDLNIDP